jgi:hypothetical protein
MGNFNRLLKTQDEQTESELYGLIVLLAAENIRFMQSRWMFSPIFRKAVT